MVNLNGADTVCLYGGELYGGYVWGGFFEYSSFNADWVCRTVRFKCCIHCFERLSELKMIIDR